MCKNRVHGRLQSKHWKKPEYLYGQASEPLYERLQKVILRLRVEPRVPSTHKRTIETCLDDLCQTYEAVDNCTTEATEDLLVTAIHKSYEFSTMNGRFKLEDTISAYGFINPSEICQNKNIQQIYKIGRYWDVCLELPKHARKHRALFQRMKLECIPFYHPIISTVFYRPHARATMNSCVECHVHAEIQLLVYYDMSTDTETLPPRVIGVNKAACYLCDLFMREHGGFFHTKTHSHLKDQWTVPDLAEYTSQQVDEYRRIITAIDMQIRHATARQAGRRLPFPMNSWISGEIPRLSPTASDAATIVSTLSVERNPQSTTLRASTRVSSTSFDKNSRSTTPRALGTSPLIPVQGSSTISNPSILRPTEHRAQNVTPNPPTVRSAA